MSYELYVESKLILNNSKLKTILGFRQHFFSCFDGVFDGTFQVERGFWQVIQFAVNDHVESFDGVF